MKRLLFITIFSVLSVTSAIASLHQQIVEIYPQPDSPLQLSNPVSKWRNSNKPDGKEIEMLTINVVTRNISSKSIRAYAIYYFEGEFNSGAGGTIFIFTLQENGIYKSNQSRTETIGEFGSIPKPGRIKLAVDFVEFTDGSTWGQDFSQSVQQLAGVRAGVKTVREYLLKINKENGIEAVIKAIDEVLYISPPNEQSNVWKRGFKTGIGSLRRQIKSVYEKEGIKAAEIELQKQFFSQNDK